MLRQEKGFDYDPRSTDRILEIGPGPLPSYDYLSKFSSANIVFVDDRKLQFNLGNFPGATYQEISFLKFAAGYSDPKFDVVIASNLLLAPYDKELIEINPFIRGLVRVLNRGGLCVVESTYDAGKPAIGRIFKQEFDKSGLFDVELHIADGKNKHRFLHPNDADNGTFSLHLLLR